MTRDLTELSFGSADHLPWSSWAKGAITAIATARPSRWRPRFRRIRDLGGFIDAQRGTARLSSQDLVVVRSEEQMPVSRSIAAGPPITSEDDSARAALQAARALAAEAGLAYAGNLSALQASVVVKSKVGRLIDVRADVELDLEGYVPGSTHVPWLIAPDFGINPQFLSELKTKAGEDEVLLFHCRRGSRSAVAAAVATRAGFQNAFSIHDGIDELLAACVDRSTTNW